MDVIKQPKKSTMVTRKLGIIVSAIALVFSIYTLINFTGNVETNRNDVKTFVVSQGDFSVNIDTFGVLRSHRQKLLTAVTDATVVEILLKSGAQVNSQSTVMRLEDPELQQQLISETQELAQLRANAEQLKLSQQRERLSEVMSITDLESELELATLKVEAESKLLSSGVVSKLNYQDSVLAKKRVEKNIVVRKQRLVHLDALHTRAMEIEAERIKQQEGRLLLVKEQVMRLDVKAGLEGVVQKQPVELGQRVEAGEQLALVGSISDLVAVLQVPQSKISNVIVGQNVLVSLRGQSVKGKVSRIEPTVTNNTIGVEVEFNGETFENARPDMNIQGRIIVKKVPDAFYVSTPPGINENSSKTLFVLSPGSDTAERKQVQFGAVNSDVAQILAGVKLHDTLILADSAFEQHDKIIIN